MIEGVYETSAMTARLERLIQTIRLIKNFGNKSPEEVRAFTRCEEMIEDVIMELDTSED